MVSKDREEWTTYQFSEVCIVNPSYKLERNKEYSYVEMAAVSESSAQLNYVQKKKYTAQSGSKFKNGDVLFARITPCTQNGKTAHVTNLETEYGFGSTEFIVLSPKEEILLDKYLYYFVKGNKVRNKAIARMVGTTGRQRVPNEFFKEELEIELPSIQEQQKIADVFFTVDKAIEKTEAIIEQTKKVKKGLVQQLLTKGIGHTKFKKTEVGEIPLDWEVKELVELANSNDRYAFTGGPFGSNLKSSDYTEDGVRIIQLQNIKDGYFANDYKIYTSESKANELLSCNIYPGDIIIAKMAEPVARACIIPNYSDRYLMASDGIRLSVNNTKYITEYVTYAINAPYFRQQAVNNSTGTTRLRIGLSTLRSLKILVPSIEEQKKIADILVNVDRKIEKEQSKVLKLKELKEGLMQSLLTGKVRVTVDEDEVTQV
ncbi:restriction endonuclease subunit S [Bacillus pseudomycoides]|uniref:Restriction endonuclease subunit S n=1 Tax=Bacillus pseudomycoides TaxID=64104 RepID=A0AAJ1Z1Y7_9BACI|nr:restriction endonuclease subunit S [Bacillus pseudomycoides]MDR4325852.1 restriction endonuclease subunit S [Bacillus pseudomycoides]MED1535659.1 restriction endonuclease subunit S [Bacillus pseudomycoides]PFZ91891.1 type I restriction endonuclease subunit S [Bacillus pseudomycoides]PHD10275.1 type I restriction endonuclease subunit S [Bacillus pseudomycoides]